MYTVNMYMAYKVVNTSIALYNQSDFSKWLKNPGKGSLGVKIQNLPWETMHAPGPIWKLGLLNFKRDSDSYADYVFVTYSHLDKINSMQLPLRNMYIKCTTVTHHIRHSPYTSCRTCFGMSNSGKPNLLKKDVCLYNSLKSKHYISEILYMYSKKSCIVLIWQLKQRVQMHFVITSKNFKFATLPF